MKLLKAIIDWIRETFSPQEVECCNCGRIYEIDSEQIAYCPSCDCFEYREIN